MDGAVHAWMECAQRPQGTSAPLGLVPQLNGLLYLVGQALVRDKGGPSYGQSHKTLTLPSTWVLSVPCSLAGRGNASGPEK
ncbi:unnamed protein product [Merluccius merluccius]